MSPEAEKAVENKIQQQYEYVRRPRDFDGSSVWDNWQPGALSPGALSPGAKGAKGGKRQRKTQSNKKGRKSRKHNKK